MRRFAVTLLCIAVGSSAFAQWTGSPTPEEQAFCGSPNDMARGTGAFMGSATAAVFPYCAADGRWRAFWDSDGSNRYSYTGGGFPACSTGQQINGTTDRDAHLNGVLTCQVAFPPFDAEPEEPEAPLPDADGWVCAGNVPPGHGYCERYEDDVMDVAWHTPCNSFVGFDLTPAERQQAAEDYIAAEAAGCPLDDGPTPPTEIACTGADGLACEDTQRSILYVLQQMLHADETPPFTPPVHEVELDLGEVTVPSFDRDNPSWDGWVEPDFTELEQDTLTARVQSGVLELRSLAETKFPFGMVTWVPTGDVAGAGSCDDPQIALMGTDARGIGWCDSAMELFLAGFGRAALAVLMTIGFGFGVVRTVSLS